MQQQKRRARAEEPAEPVEPVKATVTPPVDTAATDAILDAIEEVLEEPEEEPKPKLRSLTEWLTTYEGRPEWEMSEFEARPEPEPNDGIPWEEIARMPLPGPRGTEVVVWEPEALERIEFNGDPAIRVAPRRERRILVTREMWEEAQRWSTMSYRLYGRRSGWRYGGDDGMCQKCGWPKAGPGGPPCGDAGTRYGGVQKSWRSDV